jgi:hypothetical protein
MVQRVLAQLLINAIVGCLPRRSREERSRGGRIDLKLAQRSLEHFHLEPARIFNGA